MGFPYLLCIFLILTSDPPRKEFYGDGFGLWLNKCGEPVYKKVPWPMLKYSPWLISGAAGETHQNKIQQQLRTICLFVQIC